MLVQSILNIFKGNGCGADKTLSFIFAKTVVTMFFLFLFSDLVGLELMQLLQLKQTDIPKKKLVDLKKLIFLKIIFNTNSWLITNNFINFRLFPLKINCLNIQIHVFTSKNALVRILILFI